MAIQLQKQVRMTMRDEIREFDFAGVEKSMSDATEKNDASDSNVNDNFVTVAKVGDIPEGQGRPYYVGHQCVGVFLIKGTYKAINDICPHAGASLSAGHVDAEGTVMCPWHAWRFSLEDGHWCDAPKSPVRCEVYQVRVEGSDIQVRVKG
jgi:nitrite reductase (NADH) small subunit/3-phenylpropionate/trans-cinnamate dioxygenase ferredoxin subunit